MALRCTDHEARACHCCKSTAPTPPTLLDPKGWQCDATIPGGRQRGTIPQSSNLFRVDRVPLPSGFAQRKAASACDGRRHICVESRSVRQHRDGRERQSPRRNHANGGVRARDRSPCKKNDRRQKRILQRHRRPCQCPRGYPVRGGPLLQWHHCHDDASHLRCVGHLNRSIDGLRSRRRARPPRSRPNPGNPMSETTTTAGSARAFAAPRGSACRKVSNRTISFKIPSERVPSAALPRPISSSFCRIRVSKLFTCRLPAPGREAGKALGLPFQKIGGASTGPRRKAAASFCSGCVSKFSFRRFAAPGLGAGKSSRDSWLEKIGGGSESGAGVS